MKIRIYEDWQLTEDRRPEPIFCSGCGIACEHLAYQWEMDRQTNTEYKASCSPCCHEPLTDHFGSAVVRLRNIGKRKEKARQEQRRQELVAAIYDIARPALRLAV